MKRLKLLENHQDMDAYPHVAIVISLDTLKLAAKTNLWFMRDQKTSVVDLGNASFTMQQTVTRDGQAIAAMKVVLVCVNAAGKAQRVPDMLRSILTTDGRIG